MNRPILNWSLEERHLSLQGELGFNQLIRNKTESIIGKARDIDFGAAPVSRPCQSDCPRLTLPLERRPRSQNGQDDRSLAHTRLDPNGVQSGNRLFASRFSPKLTAIGHGAERLSMPRMRVSLQSDPSPTPSTSIFCWVERPRTSVDHYFTAMMRRRNTTPLPGVLPWPVL